MSPDQPVSQSATSRTNTSDAADPHSADTAALELRELYREPGNPGAPARHPNPEDLVLFAMHFLSGDQAYAFGRHLEQCVECHREFALIQGDLAACALTVDLQIPSSAARQRLMAQVSREKKVVPKTDPVIQRAAGTPSARGSQPPLAAYGRSGSILTPFDEDEEEEEEARPKRSLGLLIIAVCGWVLAVGLAVTATMLYKQNLAQRAHISTLTATLAHNTSDSASTQQLSDAIVDPNAVHLALTARPQAVPQPSARVTYNAANGSLILMADHLDPLQAEKVYELWLLPADGSSPIPAAVFHPDIHGNASVILPTLPKSDVAKTIGVSVEDEGGAPTPTMPFVLATN